VLLSHARQVAFRSAYEAPRSPRRIFLRASLGRRTIRRCDPVSEPQRRAFGLRAPRPAAPDARYRALRTDYRGVPGIECCAMRAKSPITFCIDENAGAPDAMTPCIALTRFCACFTSGIIAMTAFASLAPGMPAI
jgi:hypothetical protein